MILKLEQTFHLKLKIIIFTWLFFAIFSLDGANAHVEQPKDQQGIGINEKLGETIPLDLNFNDEKGNRVSLKQLIKKPAILTLVYLHCPNICSFLLQNLADVLNKLPAEPGKEYIVLAVSFDEKEKPALALEKKRMYLKMITRPFPPDAWRFLTGDRENIQRLADAVGFHFKRVGEDFEHPVTLITLSPEGKIVRYLYGAYILPFDLKMALIEASQGRIGPVIAKVVQFCFSYDPKGQKYVFNTLKVPGIVTLVFAALFIIFLVFKGRKIQRKEEFTPIEIMGLFSRFSK